MQKKHRGPECLFCLYQNLEREIRFCEGALVLLREMDCWKWKQESLDWQRRVCDEAKWEMKQKKKKKGNAESPWPPACNLQSADGEARDEEVHSIHF